MKKGVFALNTDVEQDRESNDTGSGDVSTGTKRSVWENCTLRKTDSYTVWENGQFVTQYVTYYVPGRKGNCLDGSFLCNPTQCSDEI